ncbi:histidinol dehydrogenase [Blattabacterium cuenoti]|uniref:histidinol dehydrogenase n=1 Tax=Blattabacterium cuenoti TaxID=1653831 RepID=UPI00163C61DB|nr:histidinol dehydrogenase [Blattabacterium cuenoti]
MIKIYINPSFNDVLKSISDNRLLLTDNKILIQSVNSIINNVKKYGDEALKNYTRKYDHVNIDNFLVTEKEFNKSEKNISKDLKKSIKISYYNIKKFHKKQKKKELIIETSKDVFCWIKNVPIDKIGLYIPGGNAPLLSTVLMLGIPGKLSGCKNIILCTPPNNNGEVHPSILYTAKFLGINRIYKVGGAQAIAAMAYGTKSIPSVYKIFGPGNSYVTKAKQIITQKTNVSIDVPAGPSEVVIIADNIADPDYVVHDLLSQLEHDPKSFAIIITTNKIDWVKMVKINIEQKYLSLKEKKNILNKSIKNSKIIILPSLNDCFNLSNHIAPEHLIINCNDDLYWSNKVINAGSVFLGNYSPVSAGDYATGTNHVLPTNGFAKSYSGVSLNSFLKNITFQKLSKNGLKNLSYCINSLSSEEGLFAHKNSVNIRIKE